MEYNQYPGKLRLDGLYTIHSKMSTNAYKTNLVSLTRTTLKCIKICLHVYVEMVVIHSIIHFSRFLKNDSMTDILSGCLVPSPTSCQVCF